MKKLRVALVHDYLKEYGGAERVLEAFHKLYPEAPLYTSVYLPQYLGPHRERFATWKIHTSWAQQLPFVAKLISPLRLISPLLFQQFDFSGYDLIISSATGAYFPNSLRKQKAKLVCYCHTPPRYLYGYATARNWQGNWVSKSVGAVLVHILRMVDFAASRNVDLYLSNSEEVKKRIAKFYRRDAMVVNPPVDIKNSKFEIRTSKLQNNKSYFVAGGRLARAKRIDIAVAACVTLGYQLKVFGKAFAGYGEELSSLAKSKERRAKGEGKRGKDNIEFLGEVTEEEKWELLRGARAYLFPAADEDFGILPVEAMAAGTPVIAYRSGGVQETVIEGKTGLFFDELTPEALIKVLKQFAKMRFDPKICQKRADEFSLQQFNTKIREAIASIFP